MRVLGILFLLLLVVSQVFATSTQRSYALFGTTDQFKGRLLGTNTTTNTNCTSAKPAICMSGGAFSLLARSDLNLSALPLNNSFPVIYAVNNLTMASSFLGLFTLAESTTYYLLTAVTSILGSVGMNQTYWTFAGADGNYIDAASSCGGNGSSNLTGNVGLTGTFDYRWLNSTQISCELSRPILCICPSFATPIPVSNGYGNDTGVLIGSCIAAIIGMALVSATSYAVYPMLAAVEVKDGIIKAVEEGRTQTATKMKLGRER